MANIKKWVINFIPNIIKTINLIIKALVFSRNTLEAIETQLIDIKSTKKTIKRNKKNI